MSSQGFGVPPYIQSNNISNQYSLNGELPPEIAIKEQALNRRQQIANLMLQNSMKPLQGGMAGRRFYVPPSWTQGIAQIAEALGGTYINHKVDQGRQELAGENEKLTADAVQQWLQGRNGTPEQPARREFVPTYEGQQIDLGGMVNMPGGGAAFNNESGIQPVTPGDPAGYAAAMKQRQSYANGALGQGFAPEGQPNPQDAASLIQRVSEAAMSNYPAPSPGPQPPANPNMVDVVNPRPMEIPSQPAVPATPEEKLVADMKLRGKLGRAADHILAARQHQEDKQEERGFLSAQKEEDRRFQGLQKDEDRQVRREAQAEATALRLEQMRTNANMLQMQIDERNARGQDTRDLQKQLAEDKLELQREQMKLEDSRANRHDETLKEIAKMGKTDGNKPPAGYRYTKDGNLEAIPGGPADLKLQGQLNQDTQTLDSSRASLRGLAQAANELKSHAGLPGITGLRGALPNVPGTAAANAQALLNTLKSKVAFGTLQDMRANSKTGGALGNVSDAEGKRLESYLAALDNAQDEEQMKSSLQRIVDFVEEADSRLLNAYNMKHKKSEAASTESPSAQSTTPKRLKFDAQGNPVQ